MRLNIFKIYFAFAAFSNLEFENYNHHYVQELSQIVRRNLEAVMGQNTCDNLPILGIFEYVAFWSLQ
jgi:hypothetical protein